jgi:hypothetical protein
MSIFDLVPGCLKHVRCYQRHSVTYAGFQVLKVVDLILVDNVLHITTQEKNSADLFPSHHSVQVIPNMVAEMWRRMRVSRTWKETQEFSFPMT